MGNRNLYGESAISWDLIFGLYKLLLKENPFESDEKPIKLVKPSKESKRIFAWWHKVKSFFV